MGVCGAQGTHKGHPYRGGDIPGPRFLAGHRNDRGEGGGV